MIHKLIILLLLLITSFLFSQTEEDSLNNFNIHKLNSLKTDWNVINSPLLFNTLNTLQPSYQNNPSLYTLYTNSQINAGINFELQPDVMLKRFQLVNNWKAKKKYGVFAKYLGIAQFVGAIGIATISVINQNTFPKKEEKTKRTDIERP